MSIQLNKILTIIVLLSFVLMSYPIKASSIGDEWEDIQEAVKNFTASFSIKDTIENMTPTTIIGLCIAVVILAIVFRGLILFVIMFGILVMMFGSPEKATDYLKEKFNFTTKDLKSFVPEQKKDDKKD